MSLSLEGASASHHPRLRPLLAAAVRYGLSTAGPLATSAAHFLVSLLFVRSLPPADFGLFSFVLIVVPFAMSMTGALLVIPVTRALAEDAATRAATLTACLKMNGIVTVAAALAVGGAIALIHVVGLPAILLGLYGGVLTFRWFARCLAYVEGRIGRAVASDLAYGVVLAGGMLFLALAGRLNLVLGAGMLLAAALAGLLPLGRHFFAAQAHALVHGRITAYGPLLRDTTRWSLLGVVFTEMTANAHAYLVTFVAGPEAFALLALGMLLMRPASLVQSALPDVERPLMTRQIAARDWGGLSRALSEFRIGLLAAWGGTLVLDAGLLLWFPQLVLKRGYSLHAVVEVCALSAVILALRCLRGPPALLLQAAGAFREMAGIGLKCSAVAILSTLALLLTFGPVASLGGIVAGEAAILFSVRRLARSWEARRD